MSGYRILLTPSDLRSKASNIENNAAIVEKEVAAIKQLVDHLRPTFIGESASAFYKEFDSACQNMETWDDIVRQFSTQIRDAADKLQGADQGHH